jgi:uncharacterized DUF497 family protein
VRAGSIAAAGASLEEAAREPIVQIKDPLAVAILDDSADEERHVTVGSDILGRVLVVAYGIRGEQIRLISARKATRGERSRYEGDK